MCGVTTVTAATPSRSPLPMALTTGAAAAAWTAIPEWMDRRWQRVVARVVVLGSSFVCVLYFGADEPTPDPKRDERMAQVSRAMEHPLTRMAIIGASLGVAGAAHRAENRVVEVGTSLLADRGISRPRTVFGLVLGAVVVGLDLAVTSASRRR